MYIKIQTKFKRKYGKTCFQLAKELGVSAPTIANWDKNGYDIFYKSKMLRLFKGNKTLHRLWQNLKSRCGNPHDKKYKWYGGRGIKLRLDRNDLKSLWIRDNASSMKQPSLDRIDSNKDYELNNCRFIEMEENRMRCFGSKKRFTKKECCCPACGGRIIQFKTTTNLYWCRTCGEEWTMKGGKVCREQKRPEKKRCVKV